MFGRTIRALFVLALAATKAAGAYTDVTPDQTDLQQHQALQELQASVNEHKRTLGFTTGTVYGVNCDLQYRPMWSDMQSWCWQYCTGFVNHAITPNGMHLTNGVVYFLTNTWAAAAGLTNGFRRVTGNAWPLNWQAYDDPVYSYGTNEANDIVGPWLWYDLQQGLNTLRWTPYVLGATPSYPITAQASAYRSGSGADFTRPTAWQESSDDWAAHAAWDEGGSVYWYRCSRLYYQDPPPDYIHHYGSRRDRTVACISTNAADTEQWRLQTIGMTFTFALYGRADDVGVGGYVDLDGLMPTAHTWYLWGTGNGTATDMYRATLEMGYINTWPLDCVAGTWGAWDNAEPTDPVITESTLVNSITWIVKWDFTYKNY